MNDLEAGVLWELSDLYAEYTEASVLGGMYHFALQRAEFLREMGYAQSSKSWDEMAVAVHRLMRALSV